MSSQGQFVLKIFVISAVLSILIKYGGPFLSIPATGTNALIAVLLPSFLLGGVLLWRGVGRGGGSGKDEEADAVTS